MDAALEVGRAMERDKQQSGNFINVFLGRFEQQNPRAHSSKKTLPLLVLIRRSTPRSSSSVA